MLRGLRRRLRCRLRRSSGNLKQPGAMRTIDVVSEVLRSDGELTATHGAINDHSEIPATAQAFGLEMPLDKFISLSHGYGGWCKPVIATVVS